MSFSVHQLAGSVASGQDSPSTICITVQPVQYIMVMLLYKFRNKQVIIVQPWAVATLLANTMLIHSSHPTKLNCSTFFIIIVCRHNNKYMYCTLHYQPITCVCHYDWSEYFFYNAGFLFPSKTVWAHPNYSISQYNLCYCRQFKIMRFQK
jgi:hypothetical protein